MRLLARLKMELNSKDLMYGSNERVDMLNYFKPQYFEQVIEAIRCVCGKSHSQTLNGIKMLQHPAVALKLTQLVRKACMLKMGEAIRLRLREDRQDAEDFLYLYESETSDLLTSGARQTLAERRYNKNRMLPLTIDLVRLLRYQESSIQNLTPMVAENCSKDIWKELATVLFSRVISLKKRRGDEAAKILLETYLSRGQYESRNQEIANTLSPLEKHLMKR